MDFYEANQDLHFSRIPVYVNTQDHITGFVLKDEILASIISKHGASPLSEIRPRHHDG